MSKAQRTKTVLGLTYKLPTFALTIAAAFTFAACQSMPSAAAQSVGTTSAEPVTSKVTGSGVPLAEATVQLYAMKTGFPSEPLLNQPLKTGSDGSFSIKGLYSCPTETAQTYLVATGGSPATPDAVTNSQSALATLLGPCGSITTGAVQVNELTTMAATSAMMSDLTSMTQIGSKSTAAQLTADYTTFTELVNPATGTTPGLTVPYGFEVQTTKLNAMADILATCVNSKGGKAGDASACGILFTATTLYRNPVPTDTFMAARSMGMDWNLNLAKSLTLAQEYPPFTPELTAEPTDWDLKLVPTTATPVISPASGAYPAGTMVTITDATKDAVIHFTTDGSEPTCVAPVYSQPFALVANAKVSASAVAAKICSQFTPTYVYTVQAAAAANNNGLSLTVPTSSIAVGSSYQGTLTRNAATNTATVVNVSSNTPGAVSATPASVSIPAGQTSVSFTYAGAGAGSATITATASGYTSGSVGVTSAAAETPANNVSSAGTGIPANYFGMTVLNVKDAAPTVPYGTTRSWDVTYPSVAWADSNPSKGVYSWAGVDAWLNVNAGKGIDLVYTFGRTPQWASSKPTATSTYSPGQCAAPTDIANWDNYVTALAQHAAGRIKYWEMWNEPNYTVTYCSDIPTMVTMVQHASKIIKSIDPTAVILSPAAVAEAGAAWLKTFLADGGAGYVDVITFHGYSGGTAEAVISNVKYFQQAMAAEGVSKLPLWDTEDSWGDYGGAPSITNAADQASFLAKSYLLQWSQGVSRFIWYAWDGNTTWGQLWTSGGGINPAGVAYKQTYNWMVGSTLTSPCTEDSSGDWYCTLKRSDGSTSLAAWNSTKNVTAKVATTYTKYLDLAGNVHAIVNNTVTVANSPILLEQ